MPNQPKDIWVIAAVGIPGALCVILSLMSVGALFAIFSGTSSDANTISIALIVITLIAISSVYTLNRAMQGDKPVTGFWRIPLVLGALLCFSAVGFMTWQTIASNSVQIAMTVYTLILAAVFGPHGYFALRYAFKR